MTPATNPWSFSTGERGRNRVRVLEHPETGTLFLELREDGRRKRVALGHRDRELAKAKAEEVATAWRRAERPIAPELTLETLFDNYVNEVTPRKSESSQDHDRRATAAARRGNDAGRSGPTKAAERGERGLRKGFNGHSEWTHPPRLAEEGNPA